MAFYGAWAAFTSLIFIGSSQALSYISPVELLFFVWTSLVVPLVVTWAWAQFMIDETWTAAIAYDMRIFQIRHERELENQLAQTRIVSLRKPPQIARRTKQSKRRR